MGRVKPSFQMEVIIMGASSLGSIMGKGSWYERMGLSIRESSRMVRSMAMGGLFMSKRTSSIKACSPMIRSMARESSRPNRRNSRDYLRMAILKEMVGIQ